MGINWERFYDLNRQLTKGGKRSPTKASKLKLELEALAEKYGEYAVNSAIGCLKRPQQASIGYVKAILRNNSNAKPGGNNGSKYRDSIEQAISALSDMPGLSPGDPHSVHRGPVYQCDLPM